jgi:hypothetical protein
MATESSVDADCSEVASEHGSMASTCTVVAMPAAATADVQLLQADAMQLQAAVANR